MQTYKDFATGKIKRTRGEFAGWTAKQGPLNVRYAIFKNPKSEVLVPEYCLTEETRKNIECLCDMRKIFIPFLRGLENIAPEVA